MKDYKFDIFFYLDKDRLIKVELKGVSPLLYKRKKEENEPCCEIFHQIYLFKTEEIAVRKTKRIKINSLYDFSIDKLKTVDFIKEDSENFQEEYKRFSSMVEELKEKL